MLPALAAASLLVGLSLVGLGWLPRAETALSAIALCAGVLSAGCWKRWPLCWLAGLLVGSAAAGALLAPRAVPLAQHLSLRHGLARLTFEIARGGCGDDGGCWAEATLVGCAEIEPESCVAPGVRLGVASASELPAGGTVTALGTLSLRPTFHNPSTGAHWPDLRPPVHASLRPGSQPRIDRLGPLDASIATLRGGIRDVLRRSLPAPHAGIARALLLGEGGAVEAPLNDAIRDAGVSHVLAVSGMHVTLLVGALVALVRVAWLRTSLAVGWEARRAAAALGVLLAPLVARLCGGAPSAVRAAWTSTLVYLVVALGLRPSALSIAALVVAIHAVAAPHDALHPGFVLSVLATAALLTQRPTGGGVLGALRESLRAWLSTTPFLLLCFGQTSLVALLANVALLPLGTALVPLAAAHLLAAASGLAQLPTDAIFTTASGAFLAASRFCAAHDPSLALPPLTTLQVVATWVVAGTCMLPARRRTRAIACALACASASASELSLRRELAKDELRVTVLDVGQGDAVLLETGTGANLLIDAGGSIGGGPDPGARAVVPLLRARRIARLDVVVLSHPHPDHYGGLAAVLDAVAVGELWDTGQAEAEGDGAEGAVGALLARARAHGARVRRPAELCGRTHTLGPARIEALAPCPEFDMTRGPNDNSFVLRVTRGQRSFVFTGDIEREAEAELAQHGGLQPCDVLKVAHHGSRSSSTRALLRALQPRLAAISAGRANRFGHPHAEVVARLEHTAPLVLRTDLFGGIELRTRGDVLTVRSAEAPTPRALETGPRRLMPETRVDEGDPGDRAEEEHGAGSAH